MTPQEVVAANVRARLAWTRTSKEAAAQQAQCSIRSFTYKLSGAYPFRPNELGRLAGLFGLDDPGPLYRVPEGFAPLEASMKMNCGAKVVLLEDLRARHLAAA